MNRIVIVGAGITGCVIAYELVKRGYEIILIEKENTIGGLARTFHYQDCSFDIGPHRFFIQGGKLLKFIGSILADEYHIIARHSDVYFLDNYYAWPLHPRIFFKLPLNVVIKSGLDLLKMINKSKKKNLNSFEEYILMHYGPSLYNIFFKDYTQKFLRISPSHVHPEWAKEGMKRIIIDERISSRNLADIIKLFFTFKPVKTEFIYPKRGIGIFCDKLCRKIKDFGGKVLVGALINDIKFSHERIEEIFFNGISVNPAMVIWTGSLKDICKLLNVPSRGINYLSLLIFNIELKSPPNRMYQWCYYGSKEIIFNRITMPSQFSEYMARQGKYSLSVEITCYEQDSFWNNPELLTGKIEKDLVKVGLISDIKQINEIYMEKVPDAYPVYTLDYRERLADIEKCLKKFNNLILAGRTGCFWYNNMDNSIENAWEVVENMDITFGTVAKHLFF